MQEEGTVGTMQSLQLFLLFIPLCFVVVCGGSVDRIEFRVARDGDKCPECDDVEFESPVIPSGPFFVPQTPDATLSPGDVERVDVWKGPGIPEEGAVYYAVIRLTPRAADQLPGLLGAHAPFDGSSIVFVTVAERVVSALHGYEIGRTIPLDDFYDRKSLETFVAMTGLEANELPTLTGEEEKKAIAEYLERRPEVAAKHREAEEARERLEKAMRSMGEPPEEEREE